MSTQMPGPATPPAVHDRWERLCSRFEDLIEEWVQATQAAQEKEWTAQMASMSLAAQRVAGLRAMLAEPGEQREKDDGESEVSGESERRYWEALAQERPEGPGADEG